MINLYENPFSLDNKLIRMNNSQNNESNNNKNEYNNKLFLKKIKESIFVNNSIQDIKLNENNSISLNKDKLYETFSLFQQFLNNSREDNDNGENEQNKIAEKIQQFLQEKKNEKKLNYKNIDDNKINASNKKENDYTINTNCIFNNINKNIKNMNKYHTIYSYNNKYIKGKNVKNIKKNFTSNKFIDKTMSHNNITLNLKKKYNFDDMNTNNKNKINKLEKSNDKKQSIISSKSKKNMLVKKKKFINDCFTDKIEINKLKGNNNNLKYDKIKKTNSFSKNNINKNMKDIIRNKFKNKTNPNNKLKLASNRNKILNKNNFNSSHSNSCAFFKNNFFENNINISPSKSPNIANDKNLEDDSYNNRSNNIIKRKKIIFSKKK